MTFRLYSLPLRAWWTLRSVPLAVELLTLRAHYHALPLLFVLFSENTLVYFLHRVADIEQRVDNVELARIRALEGAFAAWRRRYQPKPVITVRADTRAFVHELSKLPGLEGEAAATAQPKPSTNPKEPTS